MKNVGVILLVLILAYFFWFTVQHQEAVTVTQILDTSDSTLVFLVGPEPRPCVGEGNMECLIVNGKYFYSDIEGFDYEPGYYYVLLVNQTEVANPPAGGSSYAYDLEEELLKSPVGAFLEEVPGNIRTQN